MPIIRKKLAPSDVYPDDIRYNPSGDKVERLIDGEWKESPESDPRKQTTLPPRITADPACDAAQSVADALEGQINGILTAIDNGSTAFTIVGIILSIFSFGVFAIFVSIALTIADFMIGLGAAAIEAALPPSAWDTLKCILYCHMDDQGRLIEGQMDAIKQEVVDQIGAVGGTIINSMLDLAGEGGINGLASVGTSTGNCTACDCGCVSDCGGAPTSTTYTYINAAWITHGAYTRYSAGTPVGQFDSFTLDGTTAVLDLASEKCVTKVELICNSGCPPATAGLIELFLDGVSQGTQVPVQRVGCGTLISSTWTITGGLLATQLSMVQTAAACPGGHANYLICVKVTSCVP